MFTITIIFESMNALSHTPTHKLTLSHTSPPRTLSLTLSLTHSLTHSHTHSLLLSLSLSGEEQVLYRHHDEVLGQEVELIEAGKCRINRI